MQSRIWRCKGCDTQQLLASIRNRERQQTNKSQVDWLLLAHLIAYRPMKKGLFRRENIEKLVSLLPRPMRNGKPIAKSYNSWLIVEEYGEGDGIIVLNKITNHSGQIPYDSIREWREPDKVILSAQVNIGKDGIFELNPFLISGPETEMLTEGEEFLPERLEFVKNKLENLTQKETKLLTELVIRVKMTTGEIQYVCRSFGILDGYEAGAFFTQLMHTTQLIEKDDPHKILFTARIKDGFASILEHLLLHSQRKRPTMDCQPSSTSLTESKNS